MGTRTQILVRGIVQGVGFRPYVYSIARRRDLYGRVANNETGVVIDIEGEPAEIDDFVAELRRDPPPLSTIYSVTRRASIAAERFSDFRILPSTGNGNRLVPVSADIATCDDCLVEMRDPSNRRYRYPFINCTSCGPRFTIIEGVPYDRERTTMREFAMCDACRTEYEDPSNRRFHAEPTCCQVCGPRLSLYPAHIEPQRPGDAVGGNTTGREWVEREDIIKTARKYLADGKILTVKGIGGYHLVCDALNGTAVTTLRERKYREDKPFALMAASVDIVRRYCSVSAAEADLLVSRQRPIVLLERTEGAGLAAAVAPGLRELGFMLPYTPLHHLLLGAGPLVVTSGNVSDEPICYEDSEARHRLHTIADYHLAHNRPIHMRMDDSVLRVTASARPTVMFARRSRGYAPSPVRTSFKFKKQVLACGAELKNTFCLTRDDHAFVSHHIGDLENLETLRSFTEGIEHYKRLFDLEPEVIVHDLHPEYLSTKYARQCDSIETKIGVQHHHAHIASCLVDNGAEGEVIGVAMDGLGFGTDGRMWGGEFFIADLRHAERVAHLDYMPLPGGVRAIREPWRMAAAYLERTYGDRFTNLDIPFVNTLDRAKWTSLASMIASGTNCPQTSSMGRLFDAVSALLSVRDRVNYEGQAAIELEAMASRSPGEAYEFTLTDGGIIGAETLFKQAVGDLVEGVSPAEVSARFHRGVAGLILLVAVEIRDTGGLDRVALSGGVFQNMFLLARTRELLRSSGFEVLTHRRVPANDGGISLGQAAIANAKIGSGSI